MRKRISGLMAFICLLVAAASALAAGTTVTTFTPFADMDFAAQGYMDLITAWEDETGNMVEDYSGLEDDLFMEQMQEMVTAGRADLVVVPLGSGLTKDQLVSVDELLAAAPDCGAKRMDAMAERDGSVLLAPVRFNWEALYVNADVLEANGVAVPTNYDELIIACASLAQKGILPLANAMCEWPEIVLDCTAMIGAPADQYGQQTSLDGAKAVTTALTQVGAFGLDPWNLTDEQAKQAFMEGAAAMRFDGSDLAELVPEARQEHVVAVALAGMDGQARTALVGTPSYGLALTRACWQDSARREAALSLAQKLLGGDEKIILTGAPVRGEILAASREKARAKFGLGENDQLVVSFWGSMGAKYMNEHMAGTLALECKNGVSYHHVHATGAAARDWLPKMAREQGADFENHPNIQYTEYIYDMADRMAAADLIVCRAGAATLGELCMLGRPALLVPSPFVAENHQEKNARALESAGGCRVLLEKDATPQKLYDEIGDMLSDPLRLHAMGENATVLAAHDASDKIYREILRAIENHGK